ncbi:MAG TPA: hypothetical protein VG099_08720, partial [Gemmataceae bacterium]|nr:hypothetical protein [Gemmataceae bacterium]
REMTRMAKILRYVDRQLLYAAKMSPILAHMIKHGMPLNRQTWIDLNWGSEVPDPWTAEDEDQVPRPWQRWEER